MKVIARDYFQELFTIKGIENSNHILERIRRCISDNMNKMLTKEYKEEELYMVLKRMGQTKASRSDGYPILFFQRFWHIFEQYVISYCLGILNQGMPSEPINVTNIVLFQRYPIRKI